MIAENTASPSAIEHLDFPTPCTCPCHGFSSVRADWELELHQCRVPHPIDYRCDPCVVMLRAFLLRHAGAACPACMRGFQVFVDRRHGFFASARQR